jgi:hypothetical protein
MSWIADMLIHTVTIAHCAGLNSSGDRTYGAGVAAAARVEPSSDIVRSMDGEEVVLTHKVALLTTVAIHDKITLPDGSVRTVRSVSAADELDGGGDTLIMAGVS